MKAFAFILATIFSLQAFAPAVCLSSCAVEALTSSECCMMEKSSCGNEGKNTPHSYASTAKNEEHESLPCNTCGTPCCSAPLCCFFVQDVKPLDFSVAPVLLTGQLPSNNGVPDPGFRGDCFQPPEVVS